jgi:iron complex outermembrane receptor protein
MKYFITIILFIFSVKLYSQDTIRLKEVVVREKFEQRKQINYTDTVRQLFYQNQSLGNFISNEPGIIMKSQGNNGIQGISIRGTQNNHSQILWNGLPISSSLSGQPDYSLLTLENNLKVNIFYGINSLQLANGGIGGIIELQNPTFSTISNKTEASFTYESLKNQISFLSNTIKEKHWAMLNSLMYSSGKNRFGFMNNALLPEQWTFNEADFYSYSYTNQTFWNAKSTNMNLSTNIYQSYRDIPPLMTAYFKSAHSENQMDKGIRSVFKIQHNFKHVEMENTFGFSNSNLNYQLYNSIQNNDVTVIKSASDEHTFFDAANLTYSLTKFLRSISTFQWEQDFGNYNNLKDNTGFCKTRNQFSINQSLQQNWTNSFNQSLIFQVFNYDKNIFYLPALISTLFITNHFTISHSMGINEHTPSLNDLCFIPGGNADLKPEKAFQTEITLKYNRNKNNAQFSSQLTPYFQQIENWIMWTPSQFGYWQANNIRNIKLYGITANLTGKFILQPAIEIYSSINYSYSKVQGNDGEYSILHNPYIPVHQLNFNAHISWKNLQGYIESQCFSTRYTMTYNNDFYLLPYQLWNTNISYTFKRKFQIQLMVGLKNMFNTTYQSVIWRPMPGRYIETSIKISI